MGADFSRIRLNPLLDYAGVELKQGGVVLDADPTNSSVWSTAACAPRPAIFSVAHRLVDHTRCIQDQRRGRALTIGKGPALCRRAARRESRRRVGRPGQKLFDPHVRDCFADPIAYAAQPYFPIHRRCQQPDVISSIWTLIARSRTSNGPSWWRPRWASTTSSRVQTVWQVRVLDAGRGRRPAATRPMPMRRLGRADRAFTGGLTTDTFDVSHGTTLANYRRAAAIEGSRTRPTASRSMIPVCPGPAPPSNGRAKTERRQPRR